MNNLNELEKKFMEILASNTDGMSTEDKVNYIRHDAIPQTGSVNGLIYYSETKEIYTKYSVAIDSILTKNNIELTNISSNMKVWSCWELTILGNEEIINKIKEEENEMIELTHNEDGFRVTSVNKNKDLTKFLNRFELVYDINNKLYEVGIIDLCTKEIKIPKKAVKNIYQRDRYIRVDFEESENEVLKTIWELWLEYNKQKSQMEEELKEIMNRVIIFNSGNNTTLIK